MSRSLEKTSILEKEVMCLSKWKKAGVARVSKSEKVINIGIYGIDAPVKWYILDRERLIELLEGKSYEIPVMEAEN